MARVGVKAHQVALTKISGDASLKLTIVLSITWSGPGTIFFSWKSQMHTSTRFALLAVSCLAFVSCALIVFNISGVGRDRESSPVILYSAPSEMDPMGRVQRSEYSSLTQFLKDTGNDSNDGKALVVLCGDDGSKCPQVSVSQGDDDFEFTPMNEEQRTVWKKWLALKDRVSDLEGMLKNLMRKSPSKGVGS